MFNRAISLLDDAGLPAALSYWMEHAEPDAVSQKTRSGQTEHRESDRTVRFSYDLALGDKVDITLLVLCIVGNLKGVIMSIHQHIGKHRLYSTPVPIAYRYIDPTQNLPSSQLYVA